MRQFGSFVAASCFSLLLAADAAWAQRLPPPPIPTVHVWVDGGGAIGESIRVRVDYAPSTTVAIAVSAAQQPPRLLLEPPVALLAHSSIGASGSTTAPLPIPLHTGLIGILLHFQATDVAVPRLSWIRSIRIADASTSTFRRLAYTASNDSAAVGIGNGRYLISGGYTPPRLSDTVSLADLQAMTVQVVGRLAIPRDQHRMTRLPDGNVFVTGGLGASSPAEIYNVATNTSTVVTSVSRWFGNGAIVGVRDPVSRRDFVVMTSNQRKRPALVFDVAARTSRTVLSGLPYSPSAVALPGTGTVLFAGGSTQRHGIVPSAAVRRFDARTGTFGACGRLQVARTHASMLALGSRYVLIVGGFGSRGRRADMELFDVATCTSRLLPMRLFHPRVQAVLARRPNGDVIVCGGEASRLATPEVVRLSGVAPMRTLYDPLRLPIRYTSDGSTVLAVGNGFLHVLP